MSDFVDVARRAAQAFQVLSQMRTLALTHWKELEADSDEGPTSVRDVLEAHRQMLLILLPGITNKSNLGRHISFNQRGDYWDIVNFDIPAVEASIHALLSAPPPADKKHFGFEELLHPKIAATALPLYSNGHNKEAVVRAYEEVFIEIRRRTGRTEDGSDLVNVVLRPTAAMLIIKTLETESGQSAQKGYMELLRGTYQAFRNVLAHPSPDLRVSTQGAARHMIFASILMRAVVEATKPA